MNKSRNQDIERIKAKLILLKDELEIIRDDEQETVDNTPESLQDTDRYEIAEDCVFELDSAFDDLETAVESISNCIERYEQQ